jgi:hypothetical protein
VGVQAPSRVEGGRTAGVLLESLTADTRLLVQTRNSRYVIVVLDGERHQVLVTGGRRFPEATPGYLQGARVGRLLLKRGWIGIGFRMEIRAGNERIITSRVRSITIEAVSRVFVSLCTH